MGADLSILVALLVIVAWCAFCAAANRFDKQGTGAHRKGEHR